MTTTTKNTHHIKPGQELSVRLSYPRAMFCPFCGEPLAKAVSGDGRIFVERHDHPGIGTPMIINVPVEE